MSAQIFDNWPQRYEAWFETPMGQVVKAIELGHIMALLAPCREDHILDVGCGTGIFTENYCQKGAQVTGIDLSLPMLNHATQKQDLNLMRPMVADMRSLPFSDGCFDKTVSITALEFVRDAQAAVHELLRVTKKGGLLVIATLNSLSPWAENRRKQAEMDPASVFRTVHFRSPAELNHLVGQPGITRTAIHFQKSDPPELATAIEEQRGSENPDGGAFVIGAWKRS